MLDESKICSSASLTHEGTERCNLLHIGSSLVSRVLAISAAYTMLMPALPRNLLDSLRANVARDA